LEQTDETLAAWAQAGDMRAFDQLARRYQANLLRFVRRNFPVIIDDEDVVQEAFLKAFENLARYRPGRLVRTWLFTIAFRVAVSHIRRRRSGLKLLARFVGRASSAAPPDGNMHRDELQKVWDDAAKLLTPTQFRAIWLLFAEEMERSEIAAILGKTHTTTKLILYRAQTKMRTYYGLHGAAGACPPRAENIIDGVHP
jgi:RNA polymerase sigma-70 factor (ECF subfamily)